MAQLAFDAACLVIRTEYAKMGDAQEGRELADRIIRGLQTSFDQPPVEEFEQILHKRMSADEVRIAVFEPLEDQIQYYPILLMATEAAPEEHPLRKVQGLVLSSIFLIHRRHWSFLQEFMIRGGLDALANMLTTPNMYFRGQVIEIFICMTDCDTFDWFAPPTSLVSRILHVRMLELSDHPKFLDRLLANRSDSYPGGSARCLQILAFWLSWVRATYTQDKRLHLSQQILEQLSAWAQQGGGGDASGDAGIAEEERQLAATLHKDFGTDQYEDYAGVKPSSSAPSRVVEVDNNGRDLITNCTVTGIIRPPLDMARSIDALHASKPPPAPLAHAGAEAAAPCLPPAVVQADKDNNNGAGKKSSVEAAAAEAKHKSLVDEFKEKGSSLFKEGAYEEALELYAKALDALMDDDCEEENGQSTLTLTLTDGQSSAGKATAQVSNDEKQQLAAALHYNRAATLWKMAQAVKSEARHHAASAESDGDSDSNDDIVGMGSSDAPGVFELQRCEQACREAVLLCPGHFKATYRLAAVLLSLGKVKDAFSIVNGALEYEQEREGSGAALSSSSAKMTSSEFPINALLTLRQRCTAAALARGEQINAFPASSSKEGNKTLTILAALQRRKIREENRSTHAWSGWNPALPVAEAGTEDATVVTVRNASLGTYNEMVAQECAMDGAASSSHKASKKVKAATGKSEKKKALSTKALECGSRLKRAATDFEKKGTSPQLFALVESIASEIWAEEQSLREIISYSLEEGLILLLVQAACAWSLRDSAAAARLLRELSTCQRFRSNLSMALFGKQQVADELRATIEAALSHDREGALQSFLSLLSIK